MSTSPASPRESRTVLVLTYRFPPQGGGGVQRTLKMVKYLRRYGWRPVVHTVSNPYWPLVDDSLTREIPADVPVYRTPALEIERLEAKLSAWLGRGRRNGAQASTSAAAPVASGTAEDGIGLPERQRRLLSGGRLARLQDEIWRRLLVPDPQITWFPGALLRSLWIARREGAVAIYSSSPPNSVNVLALALQRRLGLPWVADLRDPWTDGLRRQQWYEGNTPRKEREERWERLIFERADQILVTTDACRDTFLGKYPWRPADKLTLMTNGFDPEDFAHAEPTQRFLEPGLLHVTLTGNVETMFDAVPFFSAVRDLVEGDPAARRLLRINFVGTKRQGRYDEFIRDNQLADVIRFHGYVPHSDSIQYLRESDAVMLCQIPRYESAVVKLPGKMFEYLYLRKPVLALTIPGVTTRILERARLGLIANPGDARAIRDILARLLADFQHGGVRTDPDEAYVATFDRREQARNLATLLDTASAAHRRAA
jgi:glycosyltransferase involved in cell wall biosynthesis